MGLISNLVLIGYVVWAIGIAFYRYSGWEPPKFAFKEYKERAGKIIVAILEKVCGKEITSIIVKNFNWLVFERNKLLQILYMALILGGYSIFAITIIPDLPELKKIANWHFVTGLATFTLTVWSFHAACTSSAGVITEENMSKYDNYAYDNVLYVNRICPTKKMRKIARSKYCRMTNEHIPRFDHYCWWIDVSVGEENYKTFLVFLSVQVFMLSYGTWAAIMFYIEKVQILYDRKAQFYNRRTNEFIPLSPYLIFQYLRVEYSYFNMVLILMATLAAALGVFLLFHIFLICQNMTTNEYSKWMAVKKWHVKATKAYKKAVKEGRVKGNDTDDNNDVNGASSVAQGLEDVNVGCTGAVAGDPIIDPSAKTFPDNGQPNPVDTTSASGKLEPENEVDDDTVDPGPMPKNIYNIGILGNIGEVLFPLCDRKQQHQKVKNS